MASLLPGQFELDGFVFGSPTDPITIPTGGWTKGAYDVRTQDVVNPVGDSLLFGRDRLTPAEWSWDLIFHDPVDVRPAQVAFAAAWRADATRKTPGAVSTLRYNENGKTYLVRGRPRRLTWTPEEIADPAFKIAVASFMLAEPVVYADQEQFLSLDLVTTAGAGNGLVLPATLPWTLGVNTSTTRKGIIHVDGSIGTPLRIVINGPATGFADNVIISTPVWKVALVAPVNAGEQIIIDTGLQTMSRNGEPYAGITRDSSLSLRIPPGDTEITLTADDSSASTTAIIAWRAADPLV